MKKQDLKNGDVCTLRIGSIVTNGDGFKLEFQNGNHPLSLRFYNDDLTIQNDVAELDIMRVTRNGVVIFDREQQERQAKMQSNHESRAAEYKAKKDAGNYAFDSEKAYTTEEIEAALNGFAYEKIQFDFNKFKNWFNAILKAQPNTKEVEPEINLRNLINGFYMWLDELSESEYDGMSLTDKCEKFFFNQPTPTCEESLQVEQQQLHSFEVTNPIALEPKDIHPIELLRSLPESVQLVIVNAMSEEQKTSLIGK